MWADEKVNARYWLLVVVMTAALGMLKSAQTSRLLSSGPTWDNSIKRTSSEFYLKVL